MYNVGRADFHGVLLWLVYTLSPIIIIIIIKRFCQVTLTSLIPRTFKGYMQLLINVIIEIINLMGDFVVGNPCFPPVRM